MPRLIAPGDVMLWGWGCETKPTIEFHLSPMDGGCWIELTTQGHYFQPADHQGRRTAVLALTEAETEAILVALLAPEPPEGRRRLGDPSMPDSVGCVRMNLPLETGPAERWVNDASPNQLIAIAELLLGLTQRAGLPVDEAFHPVALAYR